MAKVYVHSKRECPSDAVLREGPYGGKYYVTDERGKGAEVGGVISSFDDLLSPMTKDDPIPEVVGMVADQILPEDVVTDEFKSLVEFEIRNRVGDGEVTGSVLKEVFDKIKMDRVYVADEDQVPEGYQAMEDENGDLYYVREDPDQTKSVEKRRVYVSDPSEVPEEYEVQEGNQGGFFYETDSGAGESEGGDGGDSEDTIDPNIDSTEVDTRDVAQAMGRAFAQTPGYDVDTFPEDTSAEIVTTGELEEHFEDRVQEGRDVEAGVIQAVRNILGLGDADQDKIVDATLEMLEEGWEKSYTEKRRVYVSSPEEVPEEFEVQEGDQGGFYYETDSGAEPNVSVPDPIEDEGWAEEYAERDAQYRSDMVWDAMEDSGVFQELEDEALMTDGPVNDVIEPTLDYLGVEGEERDILSEQLGHFLEGVREESEMGEDQPPIPEDELFMEDTSEKRRVYVSDPSEVPEQYDVQEGQGGGVYYEPDSGGGTGQDREEIGDDITEEQVGQLQDEITDQVGESEMDLREMGQDMAYEMARENPEDGVDQINERVREEIEDRMLDEFQSANGVQLEGHAFDEAREAVAEAVDGIAQDVMLDEQDLYEISEGIDY